MLILKPNQMRKLLLFILVSAIVLMTPWAMISISVSDRVYRDIDTIPAREVGVLLGTSPGLN
jgi:vancomycin permeability regulator SanA